MVTIKMPSHIDTQSDPSNLDPLLQSHIYRSLQFKTTLGRLSHSVPLKSTYDTTWMY